MFEQVESFSIAEAPVAELADDCRAGNVEACGCDERVNRGVNGDVDGEVDGRVNEQAEEET
jgi:hypothetical protein